MLNTELVASIMSSGSVEFEWASYKNKTTDKDKQKLEQEIYRHHKKNLFSALLSLGFIDDRITFSPSIEYWKNFAKTFVKKLTHTPDIETIRENINIQLEENDVKELLKNSPFMVGGEYLDIVLIKFLWARLNSQFQKEVKEYDGSVKEFFESYNPNIHILGRVYFHLVENKVSEEFPFAFLATYSSSLNQKGDSKHIPLKYALQEYDNSQLLDLLTTVEVAAQKSELIAELLDSGEIFHPLAMSIKESYTFLKEIPVYENAGILCRIPNWWKGKSHSLRIKIKAGNTSPKYLGIDSLLEFNAKLLLGDQVISREEAKKILEESEGLAYIKGKWIEVNNKKLKQVLDIFDDVEQKINTNEFSIKDALQMQLGTKKISQDSLEDDFLEVSNGDWLESTFNKLKNPNLIKATTPGRNFKAQLRPYQQGGLNWLNLLHSLQFGACLADDMGLGKTVQVLAFINHLKSKGSKSPNLLVIPASLISNWQKEIERFSPSLKYFIAHPSHNPKISKSKKGKNFFKKYDIVITTYALAQKYEWLHSYTWNYVILDEAQAIKNPGTKQTKAVKKLKCYNKIVLTGTPIENKLGDLWSIYDFINPGVPGNLKEFNQFCKTLKKNIDGYSKLKNVISPYLLRRLKTDKTIIADLPDKVEMKVYADLSKKQIILYKNLVKDISKALEHFDGIKRKGIILSSLMKFKQICNHPGQYLGNNEFLEKDSGKFLRLKEICQTIFEKREKVLIFTQFKEITSVLHDFLATIFGKDGLILHGSIAVKKRKAIIERFQSKEYVPFFILSVKAGGVGLNLTEANHVIHFDRWWNPAVENQATDRAFRIGQNKKVIVHKFITKGTIEEKIDTMLEDKMSLSDQIIKSTAENWLMKKNNDEIMDLLKLTL